MRDLQWFFFACWVLTCTWGAFYALRGLDRIARGARRNRRGTRLVRGLLSSGALRRITP